ncbi:CopG family ribbon-helix-helix protein [Nonomuraea sp. AD125B]|uniref:CopG family ribbon-helix-helix protein n=1 Tax=Nonomuraea sp. AD125B TaxID=3242897 RepID=UPI0034703B9A
MTMKPKATTIRVSVKTRDRLARIARQEGRSMTEVLNDAIADYEHKQFWQEVNERVEQVQRENPEGWTDYLTEREMILGSAPRTRRIASEWEGLITIPEEKNETHPR